MFKPTSFQVQLITDLLHPRPFQPNDFYGTTRCQSSRCHLCSCLPFLFLDPWYCANCHQLPHYTVSSFCLCQIPHMSKVNSNLCSTGAELVLHTLRVLGSSPTPDDERSAFSALVTAWDLLTRLRCSKRLFQR